MFYGKLKSKYEKEKRTWFHIIRFVYEQAKVVTRVAVISSYFLFFILNLKKNLCDLEMCF